MMEDRQVLVLEEEGEDDTNAQSRALPQTSSCINIVYMSAMVAAVGGLLFGYDVGVISGAKLQVAHDLDLTCGQEELVVGLMPLGALFSSLVADPCLSGLGRKATMQLTALVFTVGALIMALASSLTTLLIGRFVVGFAVSLSAMAECIYIAEISSPEQRGSLVTLNELGITIGFLLAYIVNYIFMEVDHGWRYMFGMSIFLSILQLLALFLLPRTPHFLVMKNKETEAASVLRLVRGEEVNVRQEVADIRASCLEVKDTSCAGLFASEQNMRGRLGIALGLVILQQLTGQPNILYYATDVFQAVGFCGESLSSLAAVGLGLVKVFATIISLCLVDKLGRRTLLLAGVTTMAISLLCLTIFAAFHSHLSGGPETQTCSHLSDGSHSHSNILATSPFSNTSSSIHCQDENSLPPSIRYLAFFSIVTFVAAYSLSFGPITWIILSEIFPLGAKGRAMSLGQAVNWTSNVFVSVTFLD